MGKEALVMFFGVWVAVQSFLGFPLAWDRVVFALLGVGLLCLGILLRYEKVMRIRKDGAQGDAFMDDGSTVAVHDEQPIEQEEYRA